MSMTSLPILIAWPEESAKVPVDHAVDVLSALAQGEGEIASPGRRTSGGPEKEVEIEKDERFLLHAFRTFSQAAASLEHSYGELRAEVERLRRELEEAHAKLRREQALAEVAALLAHEVRNPLGSLELFVGLLAESELDEERREWVYRVQAGLRTLAATVNNVLHFHSLPAPARAPVNLGQLLEWARDFLLPLARQSRVVFSLQNHVAGVLFAADRHRLEQVLLNLVLNALHAMPGGGWVELGGREINGGRAVALTIADTGPGILPEHWAHIFEPGFSTRSASPGLGLAVCRKIVEQHGGTITAASPPGRGAIFTLTFPLTSSLRTSSLATSPEIFAQGQGPGPGPGQGPPGGRSQPFSERYAEWGSSQGGSSQ
jgi:signal transduction histidine kinase